MAIRARKGKGGGGGRLPPATDLLRRIVAASGDTDQAIREAIAYCRRVIDDPDVTPRDRTNASKALASLTKTQVDVALQLHKDDRIDGGAATETYRVIVPKVTDASDDSDAGPVP